VSLRARFRRWWRRHIVADAPMFPPRPLAVGGVIHPPSVFDVTCTDCGLDTFWIYGHQGAESVARLCAVCGGRNWHVAPHVSPDHQQSRKAGM
jgi:hypothetical protein